MKNWIRVKDKLPKPMQRVYAVFERDGIKEVFVAYMDHDGYWHTPFVTNVFSMKQLLFVTTHWQEIEYPDEEKMKRVTTVINNNSFIAPSEYDKEFKYKYSKINICKECFIGFLESTGFLIREEK